MPTNMEKAPSFSSTKVKQTKWMRYCHGPGRPAIFSFPLSLFLTLSSQLELGRPWCLAVPLGAASLTQFLPTHLFTITTVDYLLGKRQAEPFTSCQIIISLVLVIGVSAWTWVTCKVRDSLIVHLFEKTDQKIKAGHSFLLLTWNILPHWLSILDPPTHKLMMCCLWTSQL